MNKKNNSRARRKTTPGISSAAPHARTHSLATRAYLEIRNQILKGELPVGVALSRRKLAFSRCISCSVMKLI